MYNLKLKKNNYNSVICEPDGNLINKIKDQIWHAFLPLLAYMVGSFATMTVLMKNSLMENLSQDYVRTAFAKGLSEKRVILAHAVRNSLIPLATGIGGFISVFFAGSYLIEKTFGIDAIGLLGFNALIERDYDIMMGSLALGTIIGDGKTATWTAPNETGVFSISCEVMDSDHGNAIETIDIVVS